MNDTTTRAQVFTSEDAGMIVGGSTYHEFHDYCREFYGPGGGYLVEGIPPFTDKEIKVATVVLVNSWQNFQGDSFDRERLREIVLALREVIAAPIL